MSGNKRQLLMQTCFMFHPMDFSVLRLDIQAVRLSCTIFLLSGFVLLSCVALRSTWQRSPGFASSGAASSIQGGARQHTSTSRDRIMENKIDDSKLVPSFDGKLDQYRDYRKRALLYFNSLEDAKQNLAGPRLISNLSGPAFECFRERDPADFRNPRGVLQLLAILDDRFQFSPEQDLSDRLEELFFRLRRRRGEETTSFSTRFETLMAKTEALITEEQRAERKKQQDLQRAEYRRQSLDFIVARQEYEALLTTLADGADRPEAPRPPVPPQEMPTVQPFSFPETMKGFLFLRHIGISLQTRSSLLRSSGGSLRYDRVSDLLRRTELDALVAARAQPQGQGHGFMADAATEDNDDDDDWPEEDEVEYDDFGGYVEEEESEESFEDEQEDGAVDDEYDAAMVGYLEARRKFMDLRRARGFQEPEQSSSTAKGASKHRDRDRRDDRREGRGKPTGPSRRPDFSWRERDRRKPGQQQRGRRPGTPPPTRKKGTGKTKNRGKGSRAGSSSRRGEPAGAQYLGMAVNAATTSSMTDSPHDFVPEFSFAAFPVSVPPPPGLDASSTSSTGARQCGFVSRFALSSVEQFAEECLELDRSLGLVCPEQGEEQACCLVTPPGYAILDTGCTSTLVGSENERLWRAELEKRTRGGLQPELSQSDVRFEGINGETRASYQVRYPVRIGHRDGYVKAAVIPGRAPFLLSIQALRAMGAKLDCAADTLTVPGMGEVKLKVNSVGHYMIPLLDFPGEQSPSDRVPNDHALASAEAGFGPESELVVNTPLPRPEGVDEPPGLEVEPPGLKVELRDNASSPDQSASVEHTVPKYQSVATRADKYAIGAFLRLARETKGPWVALPRELPTVHLILGKHGFDVPNRQAWRVRAAQIGYRAKVIRRPPPQLKGGWVTVLSLDDQSLKVAVEWTRCEDCVGHQLPDQKGDFIRWLFVFALPPVTPELTNAPTHASQSLHAAKYSLVPASSDAVYTAVHVGGSETCAKAPLAPGQCDDACEQPEDFFSCDSDSSALDAQHTDNHAVQMPQRAGFRADATVRSLRLPLHRIIRQCHGDNVALHSVSSQVPRVQGQSGTLDQEHQQDRVQPSEGLRCNSSAGTFRNYVVSRRRLGPSERRRCYHRQAWEGAVSLQRAAGSTLHRETAGAEGSGEWANRHSPGTVFFDITEGDETGDQGDQGDGFCREDDGWHRWHGSFLGGFEGISDGSASSADRATHPRRRDQGATNCPGHAGQGVSDIPNIDSNGRSDGCNKVYPGSSQGSGGAGRGTHRSGSASSSTARSCSQQPLPTNISASTGARSAQSLRSGSVRSRCGRLLGTIAVALAASSISDAAPPDVFQEGQGACESSLMGKASERGASKWPRLSPEVSVGPFPSTPQGFSLPQAWKAAPLDFNRKATRSELRSWLGPQAWKLALKVDLVEVYASRARLSDECEAQGGIAIRLGHAWGQELHSKEAQWLFQSLLFRCSPTDVYVSLPCRARHSIQRSGDLESRQRALRERLDDRADLQLLFDAIEYQGSRGRHVTAEGFPDSLAWRDARFGKVTWKHYYTTFHQCTLGLRHPKSGMLLRKPTTIFTTRKDLAQSMQRFRCDHSHRHGRLRGTYQGKSLSAWTRDHPQKMVKALLRGMGWPRPPGLGQIPEDEVFYEPPRFQEHFGHNRVARACCREHTVLDQAYPATSHETTIFKVTDPDLQKQLNALQFPGRYKRADLPIPVQVQLRTWTGLEVDTITTARHVKCYQNLPTAVVATRRTTLARVLGEWFYVDHCSELQATRRIRLPVNCQLIVTFFGDKPDSSTPVASESQPAAKPVPGQSALVDSEKVRSYLQRLHVGLGHCGKGELLQHLRDAGAASWLLQQAARYTCSVCESLKPPDPHPVVGHARPRSFNSVLSIDTLDLTLQRDSVQYRVFILTAVDSATSYARAFCLDSGDSASAIQALERGWIQAYGPPDYLFCDPDTIFRSDEFARFLTRNSVIQRLSAAQSPWQHGQIERLHRTIRQQAERVFQSDRSCSPFEAVVEVIKARNELMRVDGVSPAVLVFGKLPKAPPTMAESDEDLELLSERLHREDPLYESIMLRRVAARTAWVQSETRDRTAKVQATRPRPYKGPYYRGQAVLVYRRRKGDASSPGQKGAWLGPGEIVAVESTSDKLVPRIIYVTVHGKLFLCSPEQLRPISLKAEWVRTQLPLLENAAKPDFQESKTSRGTDIRSERPTSAELEASYDEPEGRVVIESLREEAEYEPRPQAPPTPGSSTPVPGTPAGTPRPGVETLEAPVVPVNLAPPEGGDLIPAPPVVPVETAVESTKRGDKRPHDTSDTDEMSHLRALRGPDQSQSSGNVGTATPATTVLTGAEQVGSRARSRTPSRPSRNPAPRESSFWGFADFEGQCSDHAVESWFEESPDHDYVGMSVGLEFDVGLDEIRDDTSIVHILREMCLSAAAAKKRRVEVSERSLDASEKAMFREAKRAEWSQWVSNEVVELLSRRGIDPRRIISSRWVLTWKRVDETPSSPVKAKARLVIRGFKDPDLGEFTTASPTLSRQGRHAILTVAAHHQYRLFTLDAKTAFLAGDRSSRSKPIYAELPKDLIRDCQYDDDTIARIKKVPYGLSEAPLAWYRRLTAELIACGFEQVPADRCIFVLRDRHDRSRVLGLVGAHVDDLLVAGCSTSVDSQFEEAMSKLTTKLPFGDRKYADLNSVIYTGLNLKQHPQTRAIKVDQEHYIDSLKEVPLKSLRDGVLDRDGQTLFWSQLGALLWVAINTRPDIAYDVSHYASYGTRPEKQHIVALNKIVRTLKSKVYHLTFQKVAQSWADLALVVFSDAGHTSRPSGHSQSGTMMFWAPKSVLQGSESIAVLAEYSSSKIDRAVWSSYASELQSATIASDSAVSLLLLYEQILYGLKAHEVKRKLMTHEQPRVLVTDNKGLYDSIQTEKPSTRQGQKMQSLVYQILYDLVVDYGFTTYWVNAEHMLADGLTKLSGSSPSSSGGRVDLIRKVMEESKIRITYCTVSGRKEKQELHKLKPLEPAGKDLQSSIDV